MMLRILQFVFRLGEHLSPTISARLAYRLWHTPPRFKTPRSEEQALASAIKEVHAIKQHKIVSYIWGRSKPVAKPTVLLVHGWSGRGTQLAPLIEPLLDAGFRVLSFDAPAHGSSSGKQTNLLEIADVILALQAHYGEFHAAITHSFGGPCTALAVRDGLKLQHLVAICPTATILSGLTYFTDLLQIPDKTHAKLLSMTEQAYGEQIWHAFSMKTLVKDINVPGLVIHDKQDTDVPWQDGQLVAQAWAGAEFKITEGLGHRRILRDEKVIKAAVDFISDNTSASN